MPDEFRNISFEKRNGLLWQNDFLPLDTPQFVHANPCRFPGVRSFILKRKHLATVAAAFRDRLFHSAHQVARKCHPTLSGRNGNLEDGSFMPSISSVRREYH